MKWLQSVISNDILPLQPGQGRYSSFLTHKGKMLDVLPPVHATEAVMLEDVGEIGDTTFQALRKFLLYGTKAKMENCAESWGLLSDQRSEGRTRGDNPRSCERHGSKAGRFCHRTDRRTSRLVLHTEETGEVDIEVLLPIDSLLTAWTSAMQAGDKFGMK